MRTCLIGRFDEVRKVPDEATGDTAVHDAVIEDE